MKHKSIISDWAFMLTGVICGAIAIFLGINGVPVISHLIAMFGGCWTMFVDSDEWMFNKIVKAVCLAGFILSFKGCGIFI